jgi:hypothetical protein
MKLSACHCHEAAAEREHIAEQLRGRDLASPAGAEAAYQTVVADYLARKGKQVLASERTNPAATEGTEHLIAMAIVLAACGALVLVQYRRKRAPVPTRKRR